MSQEGERFKQELSELDSPEAVLKLKEINRTGSVGVEVENLRLNVIMNEISDLIEKCGVSDYLPLRSILEDLTDGSEVNTLTTGSAASSLFYQRPERIANFVAKMNALLDEEMIAPDMSLTKIFNTLGKEHMENQKVIDHSKALEKQGSEEERLDQLVDLCTALHGASGNIVKSVERVRSTKDEDRLVVTIASKESPMVVELLEQMKKIPRASVERDGKRIVFSAPFEKKILNDAREIFPWIPKAQA
jgi:hypothetical protein